MSENVGFIGIGNMGHGLAHNLQAYLASKGRSLIINNRTRDKPEVDHLLSEGATWADTPSEVASKCSITFCIMANDAALESVFGSFLNGHPQPGSIFVECSTVAPTLTKQLAEHAEQAGVTYVTGPVFGRPDAAMAKKGLLVAAGHPKAKAKIRPYQEAMGRGVLDVGNVPEAGNVMKLTGNFFIVAMTELIAEGMTLAEKNGVARESVVTFLKECFPGPISTGYAERVAQDAFKMTPEAPGFSVKGGLKDASHIQNLGRASGVPMPVADISVNRLTELVERGGGDTLDWASSALLVREAAGIADPLHLLQPSKKAT